MSPTTKVITFKGGTFQKKPSQQGGIFNPVLGLVPEVFDTKDDNKSKFISLDVKTRAGGPTTGNSYKKYVRIFEEGSPQQWILLVQEIQLIWTQNSTNGATDRVATMKSVLKGESLIAFDAALEDARQGPDDEALPVTLEHIDEAIEAVGETVFPHRALELQRLWMQRYMKKPADLTARKTASSISWINNLLPLFPGGGPESKFDEADILVMLEWSLPAPWRKVFDLKGYVPTLDDKNKLIQECEMIERNETVMVPHEVEEKKTKNKKNRAEKIGGHWSTRSEGSADANHLWCRECKKNSTHVTADCFIIKNRQKRAEQATAASGSGDNTDKARPFSKRTFRKEVNALTRKATKQNVLAILATKVQREQDKSARRVKTTKKEKLKKEESSDSDSDSEESVHVTERVTKKTNRKTIVRAVESSDDEEVVVVPNPKTLRLKIKIKALKAQLEESKKIKDPMEQEEESFLAKVTQIENEAQEMETEESQEDTSEASP